MTKENDSDNITSLRVERTHRTLKTKQQCNPEKFQEKISERLERDKPKTVKKERLKLAKLILTGTKDNCEIGIQAREQVHSLNSNCIHIFILTHPLMRAWRLVRNKNVSQSLETQIREFDPGSG